MSKIRGLGVHTYFGGFTVGVMRNQNIKTLGALESWKPAVTWAPKLGVRVSTTGVVPKADYVWGNPPCSRFSPMSYSKFESEMRTDIDTFDDMKDVLVTAKYAGAELVHIENGPLMFTNGTPLISQFQDILEWDDAYIMVFKVGSTHAGVPQLRPRTHVFIAKRPFPEEMDLTPLPLDNHIGLYMARWNAQYEYEAVPSSNVPDPIVFAGMQKNLATFLSTRPKVVSAYDKFAYSMVSSRHFAWLEEQRWWSVDEYAALQSYPATGFNYAEPGIPLSMALISKSVSPAITEYLAERIVVPYFDSDARTPHRPTYVDLT